MSNWKNVLKVQVLDNLTDLNIDMEPMTEDKKNNCCENAIHQFKQIEDDIKKYWEDLLTQSSGLKHIHGYHSVIASLGMDIEQKDDKCEFFYTYLNVCWGRLGKFLINLPTTTQNLWKRGHEIKNQLHEIMQEWEECDDKVYVDYPKDLWEQV